MKNVNMVLAAMAFLFGTQWAQAKTYETQVTAPVWECALTFNVQGGGLKFLVGHFQLEGQGLISCMDVLGNTEQIPVYVTVGGKPLSLSAGIGRMQMVGMASGVGIAGQPEDLLGDYTIVGVRGSLLVGAGADLALRASHRAITLNMAVQLVSGLGINAGLDNITIERL